MIPVPQQTQTNPETTTTTTSLLERTTRARRQQQRTEFRLPDAARVLCAIKRDRGALTLARSLLLRSPLRRKMRAAENDLRAKCTVEAAVRVDGALCACALCCAGGVPRTLLDRLTWPVRVDLALASRNGGAPATLAELESFVGAHWTSLQKTGVPKKLPNQLRNQIGITVTKVDFRALFVVCAPKSKKKKKSRIGKKSLKHSTFRILKQ